MAKAKTPYDRHKSHTAATQKAQAADGRDIGSIPAIANVKRRLACSESLRLFCETYNPQAFTSPATGERWPWSEDQLEVMAAIEKSIQRELLLAFALPRGSAKTGICRMAILWAASNALVPYAFLIGANDSKAVESLDAIKIWIRTLPAFCEDYPEISVAAQALGGIANRSAGQLCLGESTWIGWGTNRLVMPRVPKPANMKWHKGPYAPSSGVVIGASGLTGEGIRGSLFPHSDGRLIRPSLVILDDPQTDESAASPMQNSTRFRLIRGAVLGMAAPGSRISAVMPCTVIQRGDMVDQALDRKKNPAWRGIRRSMLKTMPTNLEAWEKYYAIYRECISQNEPDIEPANQYYRDHQVMLDAGAAVAWLGRKGRHEVSEIQHCMNLRCEIGVDAFEAEYQNTPVDMSASARNPLKLQPGAITGKLSRVPRGIVPKECEHLSAYIDVHGKVLYCVVSAWSPTFGGGPIDYSTYPQQPTDYFSQESAKRTMSDVHPGVEEDAYLLASLETFVDVILGMTFKREDGREMRVGKLLVDVKWGEKNKLLRSWVRRHPRHGSTLHAAQGIGIGATSIPMDNYRPDGARIGCHWRDGPPKNGDVWVNIDTNWWKSQAASKLITPAGTPNTWFLFGSAPHAHALFADHCCAEEPIEVSARGRTVNEWKIKPGGGDNHYWDCLCGSAVGGSMLGATFPGIIPRVKRNAAERPTPSQMAGGR